MTAVVTAARRAERRPRIAVEPAPLWAIEAVAAAARGDAFALAPATGPQLVGAGVAARIEACGAGRLTSLRAQARALLGRMDVEPRSPALLRPRLVGGFAFADAGADSAAWSAFGAASFVLPRWTYVRDGAHAWFVTVTGDGVREELAAVAQAANAWRAPEAVDGDAGTPPAADAAWCARVRAATADIAAGRADKVVLVRRRAVALTGEVAPADVLTALRREPRATRFWFRRDGTSFVGATPELLVDKQGARVATEALAGTAPADTPPAELMASDKDRREQEVVVRAITDRLRRVCHGVAWPREPEAHRLADLWHLRTPIEAMVAPDTHVLDLAAALHPTPAVGGAPREAALAWLAAHEPLDRGWYTGAVGWMDDLGDGTLWVALRAALVRGAEASVYAGAGIVAGSEPEAELAETELKMRRVSRALGGVG